MTQQGTSDVLAAVRTTTAGRQHRRPRCPASRCVPARAPAGSQSLADRRRRRSSCAMALAARYARASPLLLTLMLQLLRAAASDTVTARGRLDACVVPGCSCLDGGADVSCRDAALGDAFFDDVSVSPAATRLDLAGNNLTRLSRQFLSQLPHLEELILSGNILNTIEPRVFSTNKALKRLQLDQNSLWQLPGEALWGLRQLKNLRLDDNRLSSVPSAALRPLVRLEALNLANNLVTSISAGDFPRLPNLVVLVMKRNQITTIDDDAFQNVTSLRSLHLDDNFLHKIPSALTRLTSLQELSVSGNRIKYMPGGVLQQAPGLALLELRGNPLVAVAPTAFSHLPRLRKLILSDARELTEFPNLEGTTALEILRLDRAGLQEVPASLCSICPRLRSLDVRSNKLTRIPDLSGCKDLRVLDLSSNRIASLEGQPFLGLSLLHDLLLAHNSIHRLPKDAFEGLPRLQVLDLEDNRITDIHPEAFLPFTQLEDLNLGENTFPVLPTAGLERLLVLKVFNNPELREFPPPERFPRVQRLMLAYAYHCCAFLPLLPPDLPPKPPLKDAVIFPEDSEFDMSLWNSSLTDIWPQFQNLSKKFGPQVTDLWESFGSDFTYPGNLPAYVEEYFEENDGGRTVAADHGAADFVRCVPLPGPFLPCQDLFDWWTLRCGVWVVFLLAMLGNGTVVFVLIFSRSKMDVPRFLVCNLAAADFFMGIYLGFLAVVDASTLGEFRRFAIPWQMSAACQLAGFLGVLSAELSVYTLAVITLERNYAITHAMHLNKRLSLRHAAYIMLCGWIFSLMMAVLPLFGVSDYRKFAVCLPFETTTGPASLAYVVMLMLVNGVAFLILMGCYLKMYCAIRGSQAWNSNDSRIAKRMALLVFTDFICWSPVAFFSLTAAFGLELVTLEQAKIFTVFVLPLNSCCNPFLYAILTKQFKKDCVLICKAIEESRVTRGIGRCRHSSNFSNRQTPANTNSLADRSSREQQQQQQQQQLHHQHQQIACACGGMKGGRGRSRAGAAAAADGRRSWAAALLMRLWRRDAASGGGGGGGGRRGGGATSRPAAVHGKRNASLSSSENFSSSRSDSWRQAGPPHQYGVPMAMRLLEPKKRATSWLAARKQSQDSTLSSSRNDSSGSASTSTWRVSRSSDATSATAAASLPHAAPVSVA
ncbi:lutropin-choriogonadotropic hormone receptor-like [Schistocerca cancellata]|uniref:lutropin-choriogonadotropic hormone receptor-like n=1 Tax=Schistocerca cancellata TaxID=274614 RepID=UPI0021197930|nr:lutropin-choriogonadotropic hormone receptor-like [Schistocerca cancellata]